MWLDGLVVALTVGGLGTAYVVLRILEDAEAASRRAITSITRSSNRR